MSRSGVHLGLYKQSNPTPSPRSALSKPQWPQQANSRVTTCKTAHVCNDAQACGRVAEIDSQIKYQMRKFYVVPRHFVSLSVSLRFAHCLGYLAMCLILWCPHTDSNRGPTDYKSVAHKNSHHSSIGIPFANKSNQAIFTHEAISLRYT